MHTKLTLSLATLALSMVAFGQAQDGNFQIRYAANLTAGPSVINIINDGALGAPLNGPGFGGTTGNMCVNVYAFSPDEQLISCCSCVVTPNGHVSLDVKTDLTQNTLTGVQPNSIVVKLLASVPTDPACKNSAALVTAATLAPAGLVAFGTTTHAGVTAGTFAITETPFINATLGQAGGPGTNNELASITNRCLNIIGNGSGFGICKTCRQFGLSRL